MVLQYRLVVRCKWAQQPWHPTHNLNTRVDIPAQTTIGGHPHGKACDQVNNSAIQRHIFLYKYSVCYKMLSFFHIENNLKQILMNNSWYLKGQLPHDHDGPGEDLDCLRA
jgi:hypothetical protein